MARKPRHYLVDHTYHICQRGNNKQIVFREPRDYRYYLKLWMDCAKRYGLDVHAYCELTNHIHFLVTNRQIDAISRTMQTVGSNYARYVNREYNRTGSLWEGRHRAHLVQGMEYVMQCYCYIELNPVRAGMVAKPSDYPWSSYHNTAIGSPGWLTPHDFYLQLGGTKTAQQRAYQKLLRSGVSESILEKIRKSTRHGTALTDEDGDAGDVDRLCP